MIWTTTPWTLPANLAVAVAPNARYALYRCRLGERELHVVLAEDLGPGRLAEGGATDVVALGVTTGRALVEAGVGYVHPFVDGRRGRLLPADYVTLEDGTGLVHTAPGHGQEDYRTGLEHGLAVYCPVREDGTFDEADPDVGGWLGGKKVWDANGLVVERLRSSGHLFRDERFRHSYPHDWRSKGPVIFRATEQWFIHVDRPTRSTGRTLRDLARTTTSDDVRFVPDWGRSRMQGMLESRPDWCISRQRAWGLPIPAFYSPDGATLLTPASVRAVAAAVRERGSDAWFEEDAATLLERYDPATDPGAPAGLTRDGLATLEKARDIFDVWFESGSSWNAVLRERDMPCPADLYLEGSDQHRGWFQLSLLPALGVMGKPPFRAVLTHGFMVDGEGKKMSKSLGNALEVDSLLKSYGADVCRWWVSSLVYSNDIKVDLKFFQAAGEEYRKVRNTLRFLLGNIAGHAPSPADATGAPPESLEGWARAELDRTVRTVREAYDGYAFRRAHEALFDFCNDTLSAVYLAAVKDRLYCDAATSARRRRTQAFLHDAADRLIRLLAPILVHTAEEAWLALAGASLEDDTTSVHLASFPEPLGLEPHPGWATVMDLRHEVGQALDEAAKAEREEARIKDRLDAGIRVACPAAERALLEPFLPELADLCGVSRFALEDGPARSVTVDDLRGEPRCERSWKRDGTVRERSDGGLLSDRDAAAIGLT